MSSLEPTENLKSFQGSFQDLNQLDELFAPEVFFSNLSKLITQ